MKYSVEIFAHYYWLAIWILGTIFFSFKLINILFRPAFLNKFRFLDEKHTKKIEFIFYYFLAISANVVLLLNVLQK